MRKDLHKNLVIVCHHILNSLKAGEKFSMNEVLEDTFTCNACARNEPKTKKEFMDMFVSVCRDCISNQDYL